MSLNDVFKECISAGNQKDVDAMKFVIDNNINTSIMGYRFIDIKDHQKKDNT
jgi:hypothetical protein